MPVSDVLIALSFQTADVASGGSQHFEMVS
jgi:hypothetical protein